MNKCYNCETKSIHKFSDCLSIECGCNCVEELYAMYKNNKKEDIKPNHPNFLKIGNAEIKELPDVAKEISEFGRVKKSEWLPKRRDKRFKREKR